MLGNQSTGARSLECETFHWEGEPPRDEFFWISQVNKATLLSNKAEGLLTSQQASDFASAQREVIAQGNTPGNTRPKMYIHYEPLMVKVAGIEVTLMHAGRSSQDIHASFQRLMMRDRFLKISQALLDVRKALFKLCDENKAYVAPCYTNGVAAQPNNMAHTWLGHAAGFERDFQQLRELFSRLNLSPMGTTVLNGTSWPLNRKAMAAYLGFDGVVDNAYDAGQISATDIALECMLKLVSPMMHITQFIQDIMVQYAQPRPWILVTSTYASSAMPQKRNPGALIDVRRDANTVLANLMSVFTRANNLTPGMYDAKDQKVNCEVLDDAVSVLKDFARVIGMLKVNAERALEELNLDWTASQELADILMRRFGIPFRIGHHFASDMVTHARLKEFTPLTFPYKDAQKLYLELVKDEHLEHIPKELPLSSQEFREAFDPQEIVRHRQTQGGPQPSELARQLTESQEQICVDQDWLNGVQSRLTDAEEKLERDFQAL